MKRGVTREEAFIQECLRLQKQISKAYISNEDFKTLVLNDASLVLGRLVDVLGEINTELNELEKEQ